MEKESIKQPHCQHQKLVAGLVIFGLLNTLLISAVCYGAIYVSHNRDDIEALKKIVNDQVIQTADALRDCNSQAGVREKREVLSSDTVDLKSLIRGPPGLPGQPGTPGSPGTPGAPGKDGKDGKDFSSLELLEGVINKTVMKEWTQFSNKLPVYSGATYTRWGRTSCPSQSKLIYKGQMAGPEYRSSGGGTNYQCLPDDPEYESLAPSKVPHSTMRATFYEIRFSPSMLGANIGRDHRAPCAVCETIQRSSQLMIPAKTRCPAEWQLDYKGYLMSSAEHYDTGGFITGAHYRGTYVCVDGNAESVTGRAMESFSGAPIYPVTVSCSGAGALSNCPPYLADSRALSCVVCSK